MKADKKESSMGKKGGMGKTKGFSAMVGRGGKGGFGKNTASPAKFGKK